MRLHPQPSFPAPAGTRLVAQAAFPKGTLCLQIGDPLGTLYHDSQFTYPKNGVMWEACGSRQDCTPCPFRARRARAKVEPRMIGRRPKNYSLMTQPSSALRAKLAA